MIDMYRGSPSGDVNFYYLKFQGTLKSEMHSSEGDRSLHYKDVEVRDRNKLVQLLKGAWPEYICDVTSDCAQGFDEKPGLIVNSFSLKEPKASLLEKETVILNEATILEAAEGEVLKMEDDVKENKIISLYDVHGEVCQVEDEGKELAMKDDDVKQNKNISIDNVEGKVCEVEDEDKEPEMEDGGNGLEGEDESKGCQLEYEDTKHSKKTSPDDVDGEEYRVKYKDITESNNFKVSYFVWLLIFSVSIKVANATLVEFPENAVLLESDSPKTIDMACKSDSQYKLRWFVQRNRDSEREALFNGYFLRPDAKSYCTVITDELGKYNLRLENTAEAAQTYICLEPGSLREASADLIWLSDLLCSDSSTEGLVNLTCSIEFRGNWAPTMEWKEHSSNWEKVLSIGVSTETVPNQRVTSTFFMPVQNGSRNYICTTKFDINGKPPHTTATNVPVYDQKWMTSVLTNSQDEILIVRHCSETYERRILHDCIV